MNDLYVEAVKEHQAGNLDLAEKSYRTILDDNPSNQDVLHLLGILLSQRQDFSGAYKYLELALKLCPDSATLHNSMGNILQKLNQSERAVSHYEKAIEIEPDNASIYNNLGNIFYRMDNARQAKANYERAINLRPDYVDALYNLSLVLLKQDLKVEAKNSLEQVLELDHEHAEAHSSLACLLHVQGDLDQAIEHYRKSIELIGDNVLSLHNLGVISAAKQNHDEAESYFKKVLDLKPEHVDALSNFGSVLLLQKKTEEALPYFLRLANLAGSFDVYYNLGVIYQDLGNLDDAITYFSKAYESSPDDFATNANLGGIYLQKRDYAEAERYYSKAVFLEPENEEIRYILDAIQEKGSSSRAPLKYVENLFDQYAPYFDRHLEALEHRAPELILEAVSKLPDFVCADLDILDLGCGTGAIGEKFKGVARSIVGVDISPKMLDVAAKRGCYTDLKLGSIDEVIEEFSNQNLVIASDSLVYFGDLDDVFAKSYKALASGGLFVFTLENTDSYPFQLQRSARFAHAKGYVDELIINNKFIILQEDIITLRKQDEGIIKGYLFVVKKG